jgi:hypothetical protein
MLDPYRTPSKGTPCNVGNATRIGFETSPLNPHVCLSFNLLY